MLNQAVFYDIWPLGMVHETSANTFSANVITRTLAQPGYRGGIYHFFDNVGPVMNAFPAFLAETKYRDVNDAAKTAFQKAFPSTWAAVLVTNVPHY